MKLPTNAGALNDWIRQHFQVFEGPPRAYFELPIWGYVGGDTEALTRTEHRYLAAYITLALRGHQADCCKEVAKLLKETPTFENFVDATEALFIRKWFSYEDKELVGRLAFWRGSLNDKLITTELFKREGTAPRTIENGEIT